MATQKVCPLHPSYCFPRGEDLATVTTRLDMLTGRGRLEPLPQDEDVEEKVVERRMERLSRDPRRVVARKVELRRSEWKVSGLDVPMTSGSVDLKGLKSRSKLKGLSVEEMLQQRRRDEKLRAAAAWLQVMDLNGFKICPI